MRIRRFSIRDILMLTISALTLTITLLAVKQVYVNWQQLARIQSLRQGMVISDRLFDTTEKLSEERDIAYTMMHTRDPDMLKDLHVRLEESGHTADNAFNGVIEILQRYDFPELVKLRSEMAVQMANIQNLRGQIEKATQAAMAGQDNHTMSDKWFEESTALIVQTQDLWVDFSKHFIDINPIVTQHLRYKHFLRIISDYTGRERALIGRLIVENADPSQEEYAQLLRGQGIIELGWKFMAVLGKQSGLFQTLAPYYTDARSHYSTLYGMMQDSFYVPGGLHGATYPIGINLWLELSSQSKESFAALKEASLLEMRHYVMTLAKQVQWAIAMHSILLFATLCLCFYSYRVIGLRVISPINTMVTALLDATQGKSVKVLPPNINMNDEIGKLAHVLYAFQENLERFRALVEASAQVVFTWRPDDTNGMDTLTAWWEKTTGQPAAEVLPLGWLNDVHPDDREAALKIWEEASALGNNYDMEYRIRARDGEYRWVFVRGIGLKHADGRIRELVGTLTDITPRKKSEAELLAYTNALEHSNKELDDFAYIASHDLKEPLRGLFNHATFLLEDYKDKLDTDGVRKLHRLSYLAQRMERLVNDLLYFSRLGRQEMAIQPADMNEAIRDIESTLEVFLEERNAHIVIPTPLPTIVCDGTRITEVFRNLITNAVKYNDKPEKTVEIGFLERHTCHDNSVAQNVFYVKDDGRGIPAEFSEEIFRIFKRLQSSSGTEEGTGVGLTFVKKIIERHGGKIWPESIVGTGTTFYFTLSG